MIEKDYIVVGLGIAGISLCEQLQSHGKTFVAIDLGAEGATAKSGGVFNPTVLKRFTAAWNANAFFPVAVHFYQQLSEKLQAKLFSETPILRIFNTVEEQNNWTVASDKKDLKDFLSSKFLKNENPSIQAPFGFGEVMGTARIQTQVLLSEYRNQLMSKGDLLSEEFQYDLLQHASEQFVYKNIKSKKIIFAEGSTAVENPFFPKQTLIGNKGEYLTICAPELQLNALLKGPLYVIPEGNNSYKIGATYSRDDFSLNPTATAREEILLKAKKFIRCPFEVTGQTVGVRPTTKDHRPLLGSTPQNPNIFFFNGLGSRGFLMAPLLAEILFQHLEHGAQIPIEMNIARLL